MTITYDPNHPKYLDEKDVRDELTRVYDLCHGCRLCFKFCTAFPTLFDFIDQHEDQDAGRLTPAQQDQVIDECFQCKLCYINCPYIPGQSEWELDFPRLMLRADAMRTVNKQIGMRDRLTTKVMGRTDLLGKVATATPVANKILGAKKGSAVRKAVEKTAGGGGHSGGAPATDPVDEQGDAPIGSIYKWTATSGDANLPLPREGAALWSANGTLYVAGGVQDGAVIGSVHWTAPTAASGITSWKSVPEVDLPADQLRTNASGAVIGTHALLIGGEDASGAPAATSVSALTSPKAPVFRAGLFGLTIPGLAIPGEIGEQLGFLSAAGAWTLNFVLLCAMGVAYTQRERFGAWLRKRLAKK